MISDLLTSLKDLLSNEWNSSLTGDRTPIIDLTENYKRADLGFQDKDLILLQQESRFMEDIGAGGSNKQSIEKVVINVFSFLSRNQMFLILKEIERIIVANEKNDPYGDDSIDIQDLQDIREETEIVRGRKYWRWITKLESKKFIETF